MKEENDNQRGHERAQSWTLDFLAYFPMAAPMKASFTKTNWSVFKPRYLWPDF
jgi:hypothetical protein